MLTIILAGGASRRMGSDKAMLSVGGETMLQSLVRRYSSAPDEAAVSVDRTSRFDTYGAREFVDAYPGLGPVNGILAAFTRTGEGRVFLTATDIPNGEVSLAKRLYEMSMGYDACLIRRADGTAETLFAVYARACLPLARDCIETGRKSLLWMVERVNARYVAEEELPGWDLESILKNVNTPEEYEKVMRERESQI